MSFVLKQGNSYKWPVVYDMPDGGFRIKGTTGDSYFISFDAGITTGNVPPKNFGASYYASDNTGTSKDPYLSITVAVVLAADQPVKISSGHIQILGGKLIIK